MTDTAFKRIVMLTQDYYPDTGGITTWCDMIARELHRSGHEIVIVTKSFDNQDYKDNLPFEIIRMNKHRWRNNKYQRLIKTMLRFNLKETVFLCANWKMAVPCWLLSLVRKVHYFTVAHGRDAFERRKKNRFVQKSTFRKSNGVISVSNYTRGLLAPLEIEKKSTIRVINNGVDVQTYRKLERNPSIEEKYEFHSGPRLLSLARLEERKGFDMTIKAMQYMKSKNIHYYLAGTGGYEKVLRRMADEYNVTDRVHFLGFIPPEEIVDVYNCADIYVMPSREIKNDVEGFGITYLEAAACGVPSIAGRNSGAEDAVLHDETGLLVDPESPEEIANAVDILLSDEQKRLAMGNNALQRAEREFTWEIVTQSILDFMSEKI